jgi:YVTN family beta-propeller protein
MNTDAQGSKPIAGVICVQLRLTSWAVRVGCAIASLTLWQLAGYGQSVTASVPVGTLPLAVAANPITNKIYVANFSSDNVTVIDGATNTATTVNASGNEPVALAVNPLTNKIYVVNAASSTVTVIDGATNATTSIVVETAGNP